VREAHASRKLSPVLTHCFRGSRVYMAIVAGCVTGVLGLTNTLGLLSYVLAMALVRCAPASGLGWEVACSRLATANIRCPAPQTSVGVFLKLGGNVKKFFVSWCARAAQSAAECSAVGSHRTLRPRKSFCLDGLFDAAMTYLLIWTCVPAPACTLRRAEQGRGERNPSGTSAALSTPHFLVAAARLGPPVSSPLTHSPRSLVYNVVHLFE